LDLLQALADIAAFAYDGLQLQIGLEQRMDERVQELDSTRSDLENVAQWLLQELRAPLRQIELAVRQREVVGGPARDQDGIARAVADGSRQFDALADGISNFLRSGRTPLRREPVDVTTLVRGIWRELEEKDGMKAELRLSLLPAVHADRALLGTALRHILSNARKFSRAQAPGVVEVTTQADGEDTIFVVTDNGEGCDLKKAPRLFSMLQRYHPGNEFAGAGAGLAIAQRILRRHGGKIWAKSQPGEGMAIYFTLPYRDRAGAGDIRFSQR
jgi:two-component system sensor kinase